MAYLKRASAKGQNLSKRAFRKRNFCSSSLSLCFLSLSFSLTFDSICATIRCSSSNTRRERGLLEARDLALDEHLERALGHEERALGARRVLDRRLDVLHREAGERVHLLHVLLQNDIDLSYCGPVQGFDVLSLAAYYGRGECVECLLERIESPSVSARALLYEVDDVPLDMRDSSGRGPLHLVAASRYWRHVGVSKCLVAAARLIERGADVSAGPSLPRSATGKTGPTPLWWCMAWSENAALCKWLLLKGARADGILNTAVIRAPLPMVDALLEAGADINEVSPRGRTPLLDTLTFKVPERARYLLDRGADAKVPTENGYWPLHVAVLAKLGPSMIGALLDAGSPAEVVDPKGNRPLDLALNMGQHDVAQLLTVQTKEAATEEESR